jgi:uncharacterized phiE125 gp8 family phage protein
MSRRLKLVTPPEIEPVTLAEALAHCHVDEGVEDTWFTAIIRAARENCENFQWRAYISQGFELSIDGLPQMPIELPRAPLISVDSIKVYDNKNVETTMALSDFFVDDSEPARIVFAYGKAWPSITPREIGTVKIAFTAGYAQGRVPTTVKQAMLLFIGHAYENRSGEVAELPRAYYDLLRPDRMYQ